MSNNKPVAAADDKPKRKIRSKKVINKLLIDAAREEFKRCGFAGATTAAIARNAAVTETQLFRHFPSKAELFRAAVFEPLNEHLAEFNQYRSAEILDTYAEADQARRYIAELQAFLGEHSKLLLSLLMSQIFTTAEASGIEQVSSLEAYFQQGASLYRHRLNEDSDVNPDLMVRVPFAALMGCVLFKNIVCPPGLASEETINAAIIDFMLNGIAPGVDLTASSVAQASVKTKNRGTPNTKQQNNNKKSTTSAVTPATAKEHNI